jgi:hypothetical protein
LREKSNKTLPWGLITGFSPKNAKIIAAVFPRGPKRGNPTMTTSTITARRKGDPQHVLREKVKF